LEIDEVAGVRQGIQVYNLPVLHLFKDITDKVCPDKSGTSGNQ
jgi:hypothetical protein